MKLKFVRETVAALALITSSARADWPTFDREIQRDVIALDDTAAEQVRRSMEAHLRELPQPAAPHEVRELATTDHGYLLHGDLFGTGGNFALYEPKINKMQDSPTLALAEQVAEKWVLRGLWRMPIKWVSNEKHWAGTGESWFPKETPLRPFVLENVVGDKTPEVIVAGELLKYRQVSYLLGYDSETHGLKLQAHAMAKPVKVGNLVRLYESSPNKAIWSKWTFLGSKDGKLEERASWYSNTPYNNVDPPYSRVTTSNPDGTLTAYRVNSGNFENETQWNYEILKDAKPFAKIAVKWMPEKTTDNRELMEGAWIFEKLTGLPRGEFPQRYGPETEEKPKLERLENFATVEVEIAEGNEEARQQFLESN